MSRCGSLSPVISTLIERCKIIVPVHWIISKLAYFQAAPVAQNNYYHRRLYLSEPYLYMTLPSSTFSRVRAPVLLVNQRCRQSSENEVCNDRRGRMWSWENKCLNWFCFWFSILGGAMWLVGLVGGPRVKSRSWNCEWNSFDFKDALGGDSDLDYALRVANPGDKVHNLQSMIFSIAESIVAAIILTTHVWFVIIGNRISYLILISIGSLSMNPKSSNK